MDVVPAGRQPAIVAGVLALTAGALGFLAMFPDYFGTSIFDQGWEYYAGHLGLVGAIAAAGAVALAVPARPGVALGTSVGAVFATRQFTESLALLDFDFGTGPGFILNCLAAALALGAAVFGLVAAFVDGPRPNSTGVATSIIGGATALCVVVSMSWTHFTFGGRGAQFLFDEWTTPHIGYVSQILAGVAVVVLAGVLGGARGAAVAGAYAIATAALLFSEVATVAKYDELDLSFAFAVAALALLGALAITGLGLVGEVGSRPPSGAPHPDANGGALPARADLDEIADLVRDPQPPT